jgi:acyl carrier protein
MEVKDRVIELLAADLDVPKTRIRGSSDIREDLKADSLAIIDIMMGIEEEFGLKFENVDFEEIRTVDDLVRKIEKMRLGW